MTHAADHMESNAGRADTVAHADDELTRHPSPAQVTEATAKAKTVRVMMKAGEVTPAQAAPIINGAEEMRRDRDTAFNVHANAIVPMEDYNPPANSGGGDRSGNYEGDGGGGQSGANGTENTPTTVGDLGGSSAGSDGAGGGAGGSSVGDSAVGTTTSGDGDGASGSALGGQSQGAPSMQPMQGQGQPQGTSVPSTGGGPTAGTGAPFTGLKAMPPKKRKGDGDNGLPTALSGGGAVVPVAGDQLGPKNGSSVHDVTTKSSTTGQNAPAVSATGAKPGGGAGGGAGGMGRGGVMGGGMGSGAGMGGSAKAKKPDDTISAFQDRNLTGQVNVDHAVEGGSIGRDTANPPDFEDGNVLDRDSVPRDMRERSERKDI
ncbi:hypothetical protein [Mycolicibacter acidiphilus]|uniref:hypothetical protein n=1 Tax=Mycolicibacter acidiphilus TaxID=2835306 RepID=UPI001BD69545|nr:hypothetical protein [Mycolicibacter acidiphilus]